MRRRASRCGCAGARPAGSPPAPRSGGVVAQFLAILALAPPLGVSAMLIMVPTALALLLLIVFGKETRGRDLRDLDAALMHAG